MLDKLCDNISMLSSIYYKPPEQFVKKIRDRINERLDQEYDEGDYAAASKPDYEDSMDAMQKNDYAKEVDILGGNDLLGVDAAPEVKASAANPLDELLGMGSDPSSSAATESEYDPDYSFTPVPMRKLI